MWLVYLPASFYFVYLAIKARTFFFFAASNPTIENGGLLFESKWKIFNLIPNDLFPSTLFVNENEEMDALLLRLQLANIKFPFIAKPDVGGRGFGVMKITCIDDLIKYRDVVRVSFLIQEYIDFPLELSVFYVRNPNSIKGEITSVTVKELLTIKGDGVSTIDELINHNDRAFLQYSVLRKDDGMNFNEVLELNKVKTLVPYGNHVRGAKFLDYSHIIDSELTETFDNISSKIDGFYFGRFDIRCSSIEDLKKGKNISILELNGAGAEPAHIYDPNFSYFKAQKVLCSYFKNMYMVSSANHKLGVPYMTLKEFVEIRKLEKQYKSKINLI